MKQENTSTHTRTTIKPSRCPLYKYIEDSWRWHVSINYCHCNVKCSVYELKKVKKMKYTCRHRRLFSQENCDGVNTCVFGTSPRLRHTAKRLSYMYYFLLLSRNWLVFWGKEWRSNYFASQWTTNRAWRGQVWRWEWKKEEKDGCSGELRKNLDHLGIFNVRKHRTAHGRLLRFDSIEMWPPRPVRIWNVWRELKNGQFLGQIFTAINASFAVEMKTNISISTIDWTFDFH